MVWSLYAVLIGFGIDLIVGDPPGWPHPVIWIGRLISALEIRLRGIFSPTPRGERWAGGVLWVLVVLVSTAVPAVLLWGCGVVHSGLRLAAESVMCWQILAAKSLRDESMKVYAALESGDLEASRRAVRFYFPGADVKFHMTVNLCADVEAEAAAATPAASVGPKILDLEDFL